MGKYLIKDSEKARRSARLVRFCTEIKRALFGLCIDHNVPTKNVDFFIEEFYMRLDYHEGEYRTETLLEMLLDEGFVYGTFERFCQKA